MKSPPLGNFETTMRGRGDSLILTLKWRRTREESPFLALKGEWGRGERGRKQIEREWPPLTVELKTNVRKWNQMNEWMGVPCIPMRVTTLSTSVGVERRERSRLLEHREKGRMWDGRLGCPVRRLRDLICVFASRNKARRPWCNARCDRPTWVVSICRSFVHV